MWEPLWRPRPSCLTASCWDAVSNLFRKWIGFQIDSLGNWTPLFVPQTGITCELQVEAEHGVQGQLLVLHGVGVWGGCGRVREHWECQINDVYNQMLIMIIENQPPALTSPLKDVFKVKLLKSDIWTISILTCPSLRGCPPRIELKSKEPVYSPIQSTGTEESPCSWAQPFSSFPVVHTWESGEMGARISSGFSYLVLIKRRKTRIIKVAMVY